MADSFVIDRRVWLRGEGPEVSVLLRRRDSKRCCLGIYLQHLGFADFEMEGVCEPCEVVSARPMPHWLESAVKGSPAQRLIDVNDDYGDEANAQREPEITRIFAEQGVSVTFEN